MKEPKDYLTIEVNWRECHFVLRFVKMPDRKIKVMAPRAIKPLRKSNKISGSAAGVDIFII